MSFNTGAFGEGFPYSNFHDLNMDWIIKIAKDFLDQYTHIQEIIEQGKTDIQNLTESGLTQLQEKADTLEGLLQAWYNEHSEDIANQLADALTDLNDWYTEHSGDIADQLADALADLNDWYTTHQNYLDATLIEKESAFDTYADTKTASVIESIPDDYTALANKVTALYSHYAPKVGITANRTANYNSDDNWLYPTGNFAGVIISNPVVGHTYRMVIIPVNDIASVTLGIINYNHNTYRDTKAVTYTKGVPVYYDFEWLATYTDEEVCISPQTGAFVHIDIFDITNVDNADLEKVLTISTGIGIGFMTPYNNNEFEHMKHFNIEPIAITANSNASYDATTHALTPSANFPGVTINNPNKYKTYRVLIKYDPSVSGEATVGITPANHSSYALYKTYDMAEENIVFDFSWLYDSDYEIVFAPAVTGGCKMAIFDITDSDAYTIENFTKLPDHSATPSTPLNVYTKDEINRLLDINTKNIYCFGDSLTYGAGRTSASYAYPGVLNTLLTGQGYAVENYGIGGETAMAIAIRAGAMPVYAKPFTIPADATPVTIELESPSSYNFSSLLHQGNNAINPVSINGITGNITWNGSAFVFTRLTSGSITVVERPTLIITNMMYRYHNVLSIWIGTNDIDNEHPDEYVKKLITIAENMIAHNDNDKYIIIGLTATTFITDIITINQQLANRFGQHFIDARTYLINYGLEDEGITPTTQDEQDILAGRIPTSLRHDEVHLNDYGYDVIGNLVYKTGKNLGYWN